jgi:hypothetical protein
MKMRGHHDVAGDIEAELDADFFQELYEEVAMFFHAELCLPAKT